MEKQEKKKKKGTSGINYLPHELFCSEILSRLPIKSIIACKLVTKPLHCEINSSFFKQQLFSSSPIYPLLFINPSDQIMQPLKLHLVQGETSHDLDQNRDINSTEIKMLKGSKLSPFATRSFMNFNVSVTSCEGVICSAPRGANSDHVIISNPITNEYISVDLYEGVRSCCRRGRREGQLFFSYFIGLGCSRVDSVFKLLRISKDVAEGTWWLEVSVVGTGVWRRLETPVVDGSEFGQELNDVVYLNGVMYWNYRMDDYVCCFDFDSEKFHILTVPDEIVLVERGLNIGVLGGSLCVSLFCPSDVDHYVNVGCDDDDMCAELWIFEKDDEMKWNWRSVMDFNVERYHKKREKWLNERKMGCFKAIKYVECGKILMHDDEDVFLIYDPSKDKIKFIRVLDDSCLCGLDKSSTIGVVPHVPTLVSLRDALKIEDATVVEKYY